MRKLLVVTLVAALAIGGASVAFAEDSNGGTERARETRIESRRAGLAEKLRKDGPRPRLRLLHGEAVALKPDGSLVDVARQRGEVEELSDDSITVVSKDDYSRTYVIDMDTRMPEDLEVGDQVGIGAVIEGDEYLAKFVHKRPVRPGRGAELGG